MALMMALAYRRLKLIISLYTMHTMHINDLDLNLLRAFDAVYRLGHVSRAAESIGLTQPAASHAITRLRLLLGDPLFVRSGSRMTPTPRAQQLAGAVTLALSALADALDEPQRFDPARSHRNFRLHMSDIGEARFLPQLMAQLRQHAPGITIETQPLPHADMALALDAGRIDFAIGFLPGVEDTEQLELLHDTYVVLVRRGHPVLKRTHVKNRQRQLSAPGDLQLLDYAAVRSHSETLRLLQLLKLDSRLKLTASHFLALPDIVRQTNLAVLVPKTIAQTMSATGDCVIIAPPFALQPFAVSLHWSRRTMQSAAHQWLRALIAATFVPTAAKPVS